MDNEKINFEHIEALDSYFAEIRRIRPLKREEERELSERIRKGDRKALDKLVRHNLRFVVNVAKAYRNRGVPFSDLIAEGNIGLMKAAEKFDGRLGLKFISYAVSWVKCYIGNCIKEKEKRNETLCEDIVDFADIQHQGEYINEEFEEKLVNIESRRSSVAELMKCLHEREIKILTLFYGLGGGKEMTLEEVGKETNLTMERVRQIKDKAMVKLKCRALSMRCRDIETMKILS